MCTDTAVDDDYFFIFIHSLIPRRLLFFRDSVFDGRGGIGFFLFFRFVGGNFKSILDTEGELNSFSRVFVYVLRGMEKREVSPTNAEAT